MNYFSLFTAVDKTICSKSLLKIDIFEIIITREAA